MTKAVHPAVGGRAGADACPRVRSHAGGGPIQDQGRRVVKDGLGRGQRLPLPPLRLQVRLASTVWEPNGG